MKKLAILDTEKNVFSVYDISEDVEENIEDYLEMLIDYKIISGMETIHWQVMPDLIIRNYSK